ncbi:hypothetical protein AV521_03705 [Streptomyces sp. IMTB 2501]|uniref:hypothetical protein n=1 Tax=Streptomyces sp. IMTB 2501 TaxID=1776340 RepID=UPI00096DAC94|nr:hypothetical protein [Streptomyces sp. IMTB 2501]OLZ74703.1 hypothetical protein AV521_03705 [Streptomyces sp. IMTB 2501]
MDAPYFTGPEWTVSPAFAEEVSRVAAGPHWIVDSVGYPEVRDLLWDPADTVLWLDHPRRVIMPRILCRSLRRTVTREALFGDKPGDLDGLAEQGASGVVGLVPTCHQAPRDRAPHPRCPFAPLTTFRFHHPDESVSWLASLDAAETLASRVAAVSPLGPPPTTTADSCGAPRRDRVRGGAR